MIEFLIILFAPLFGGIIYGFERVVKARMQNRTGPCVLQPFYDMFKLFDKKAYMINSYHIVFALMHFFTLWAVIAMVILGENLLYIVFIHLLSSLFLVIAGFSVNSVYSHMGSNRELLTMIAYEPILILFAIGFYLINGTFDVSAIYQSKPQIANMFLLFLALVLIIPIKLKKSPFDAAEAHQEIVGGLEIEYGGIFYEIVYTAKWLEYVFVYLLVSLFAGSNFILALILCLSVFLIVNLVDNSTARVKIDSLIKITLTVGISLAILNILGIVYV